MSNWNLADWALLATIFGPIIAIITLLVSNDFRKLMTKWMRYQLIRALTLSLFVFMCGWIIGTLNTQQIPTLISRFYNVWPPREGILAAVQNRGYLRCGVHGGLHGFSKISGEDDENGFYENADGFDADFCRVVATSIFGDFQGRVKFLPLDTSSRFLALEEGQIDVLFRNTSATIGREFDRNIEFGPTIFYDEQSFMVLKSSSLQKLQDLDGHRICVVPDTTTFDNLKREFNKYRISYTPIIEFAGKKLSVNIEIIGLLNQKRCDAVTSDKSQLVALINESGPSERYRIIPKGISKELLSPAVIRGDEKWSRIVRYSILSTIEADEIGVNRTNVNTFTSTTLNSRIKEFLGLLDHKSSKNIGNNLGIRHDFTKKIMSLIGNYNDIYERNLGSILPERGWNQLWNHCDTRSSKCGLLISPPFTMPKIN